MAWIRIASPHQPRHLCAILIIVLPAQTVSTGCVNSMETSAHTSSSVTIVSLTQVRWSRHRTSHRLSDETNKATCSWIRTAFITTVADAICKLGSAL
ncbi:hypothetical protein V8C43DRAFT_275647 [Trichoderma afarasin]